MSFKSNYMSDMLSLEEIISRSNKKHRNKYDYSKTNVSFGRNTIMKIICPLHGLFGLKQNHIIMEEDVQNAKERYSNHVNNPLKDFFFF